MNREEALKILDLEVRCNISQDEIKKRYHKMALQYHPDKNGGSDDSKQRFQLIQEAFEVLTQQSNNNFPNSSSYQNHSDYNVLFQVFLDSFMKTQNVPDISVIKEIVLNGCKVLSMKLFENMNKDISINTLSFLCKHKDILHIDEDTIEAVKHIITKKYENDQVFILNPTLDDMLSSNVYKLNVNEKTYFVPLWHSETYFDTPDKKGEIIVKCIPTLPDNVDIDQDNTLHVHIIRKFSVNMFSDIDIPFSIGKHNFNIPQLLFKQTHTYCLKNQGIAPINTQDIYDVTNKAGMYVTVTFID